MKSLTYLTYFKYVQYLNSLRYYIWTPKRSKKKQHKQKQRPYRCDDFKDAQASCGKVLTEEYQEYVVKLKERIATLKRGSKQWWKLNRELLDKKAKISSIPPLRDGSTWLANGKDKADLFAKTFSEKSELPKEEIDCPFFGHGDMESDEFFAMRTRYTLKLFKTPSNTLKSTKTI